MIKTPKTDAKIAALQATHVAGNVGDFEHYYNMAGELAAWSRQQERLAGLYQLGLEQIVKECPDPYWQGMAQAFLEKAPEAVTDRDHRPCAT